MRRKSASPKAPQSELGPKLLQLTLILGCVGFILYKGNEGILKLGALHEKVFQTKDAKNRYSFSFGDFALVVKTSIKAPILKDQEFSESAPYLTTPLNYKISHSIGFNEHKGQIELKLSENPVLAGHFNQDLISQFSIQDDIVSFIHNPIEYKTLGSEFLIKSTTGTISFNGPSEVRMSEVIYKSKDTEMKAANAVMNFNLQNPHLNFHVASFGLNGVNLQDFKLAVKRQKTSPTRVIHDEIPMMTEGKSEVEFTGSFENGPLAGKLTYETLDMDGMKAVNKVGEITVPSTLVNAFVDPVFNAYIGSQQEQVAKSNNKKLALLFQSAMPASKEMFLKKFLEGLSRPGTYEVKGKSYHFKWGEKDHLQTIGDKKRFEDKKKKILDGWLKMDPAVAMLDAQYAYILSPADFERLEATGDLLKTLAEKHSKTTAYRNLKIGKILHDHYYSGTTELEKATNEARILITDIEKTEPEGKGLLLSRVQLMYTGRNQPEMERLLDELIIKENDPQIKSMLKYMRLEENNPAEALKALSEAELIDPKSHKLGRVQSRKAHLYEAMGDMETWDRLMLELVNKPKPHRYDIINYASSMGKRKDHPQYLHALKKCAEIVSAGTWCRERYLTASLSHIGQMLNESKFDEAIVELEKARLEAPENSSAYFWLGKTYEKKNDQDKAIEHYLTSCSLGEPGGCNNAALLFKSHKQDPEKEMMMYESSCERKNAFGCLWAGLRYHERGMNEQALPLVQLTCVELKHSEACYHTARVLQQMKKSKEEVSSFLDKACSEIPVACQLSPMIKEGKNQEIPYLVTEALRSHKL